MKSLALILVAILASTALAGCVSERLGALRSTEDALSLPTLDANKTVLLRVPLTTKDGVKLDIVANMSQQALDAGEKLPVIVDIGPYFSTGIMRYGAIDKRMADYFVPRGYVMARAALRGTGESGGCFDLGGPQEQKDVHDIVEFLGTQPWSNGNVAVFGKSYDGTTPWEAAITQPSHLKTIVPISGITDMYRYTFYDGTTYPEEVAFEPYYYLFVGDDISAPGPDGGPPAFSGDKNTLMASINPCEGIAFAGQTQGDMASTLTGDHGDKFWLDRDYELHWSNISVPVFLVHGMQDWNVKPDHEIPLFNDITTPKAAWFGQWEHNYPDVNTYKPEWSRHDWNETLLTWFDHWLKGKDNDWQKVAHVEAQDQAGTWTTYANGAWPPADAVTNVIALTSQGTLATNGGVARTLTFSDPLNKGYEPLTKANGLGFLTGPMSANVTLLGRASADIKLSIDRPNANLVLALYDVDEAGKWTELDHGMRDLRHRDSRETGSLVAPGQAFNTTVWAYPEELVIAKGHRLGLSLGASFGMTSPTDPRWIEPASLSQGATFSVRLGQGGSTLRVLSRADSSSAFAQALAGSAATTGAAGASPSDFVAR